MDKLISHLEYLLNIEGFIPILAGLSAGFVFYITLSQCDEPKNKNKDENKVD